MNVTIKRLERLRERIVKKTNGAPPERQAQLEKALRDVDLLLHEQSQEIPPQPWDGKDLESSYMFWMNAKDYCVVAKRESDVHLEYKEHPSAHSHVERTRFPGVLLNQICTSIELCLKGFLRAKEYSVRSMQDDYGHNLIMLLCAARMEDIESLCKIDDKFVDHLWRLSAYNDDKEFEYLVAGVKGGFPDASVLLAGTESLVNNLEAFCFANRQLHDGKLTACNPYKDKVVKRLKELLKEAKRKAKQDGEQTEESTPTTDTPMLPTSSASPV